MQDVCITIFNNVKSHRLRSTNANMLIIQTNTIAKRIQNIHCGLSRPLFKKEETNKQQQKKLIAIIYGH